MTRFPALLDTNVLFGSYLNDVLLTLAERGLFRPLWSEDILEELERNLVEHSERPELVRRRLETMRTHFPDALVAGYGSLTASLTCHPKDRLVLAAAIRARAAVLVTFNLKDFPPESTEELDVEVVHPDQFLLDQLDLYPGPVIAALHQLASDYSRPELSVDDLLVVLARSGVPGFAHAVRPYLG